MAKRPKQGALEGVEVSTVPDLSRACSKLAGSMIELARGKEEVEDGKREVAELMHEHKLDFYVHGGRKFVLDNVEKLRVKKVESPDRDPEE